MRRRRPVISRRGALAAAWAWVATAAGLQGCGGGGGGFGFASVGSGGTGISGFDPGVGSGGTGVQVSAAGPIEGFGSIVVNGTRFDTDSAVLQLSDVETLRLGMTVQVYGTMSPDGLQGKALLVTSSADLRGPVAAIDVANASFSVLGTTVRLQPDTVFGGGLAALGDLRNGDPVQVHGLPGAAGTLAATRVEKLAAAATATPVLSGVVQELDPGRQTFLIGAVRVSYTPAALTGLAATGLSAGQSVRVRVSAIGAILPAVSIEPWYPAASGLTEGAALTLAGLVADSAGTGSFRIDGIRVDATAAKVSGGPTSDVRENVRVDVTGTVRNGILVAERVKIRHGADATPATPAEAAEATFSASGSVGAYRSPASFKVQGQDIDASGATYVGGTAADLRPGRKVLVTGSRVVNDVLIASRVEFT